MRHMRHAFLWGIIIVGILFLSSIHTPTSAQPAAATRADGVVRAVLFWRDTCPHCHIVIEQVLPPLQQQYGAQLDIQLIEVSTEVNANLLLQAANTFGIPYDQVGVPFMVIGDRVLVGSTQIPAELPGLIEQYLAQGGVDYPDIPGLADALALEDTTLSTTSTTTPATVRPSGFALAIATLSGMVFALVATAVTVLRGMQPPPPRRTQRRTRTPPEPDKVIIHPALGWLEQAIPVLALVGLGVASYLAYVETQAVEAVCGPVGDCNAVQSSPYAYLFGIIPVGLLGAVAYLGILVAWLWSRIRSDQLARYAPLAVFGMALVGTLFSLYLTFLEPFVIRAVCIWCLTSAVVITLLLLASVGPAVQVLRVRQAI